METIAQEQPLPEQLCNYEKSIAINTSKISYLLNSLATRLEYYAEKIKHFNGTVVGIDLELDARSVRRIIPTLREHLSHNNITMDVEQDHFIWLYYDSDYKITQISYNAAGMELQANSLIEQLASQDPWDSQRVVYYLTWLYDMEYLDNNLPWQEFLNNYSPFDIQIEHGIKEEPKTPSSTSAAQQRWDKKLSSSTWQNEREDKVIRDPKAIGPLFKKNKTATKFGGDQAMANISYLVENSNDINSAFQNVLSKIPVQELIKEQVKGCFGIDVDRFLNMYSLAMSIEKPDLDFKKKNLNIKLPFCPKFNLAELGTADLLGYLGVAFLESVYNALMELFLANLRNNFAGVVLNCNGQARPLNINDLLPEDRNLLPDGATPTTPTLDKQESVKRAILDTLGTDVPLEELNDLFNDISSLLLPTELCMLLEGEPEKKTLDMIKNLIKTSYPQFTNQPTSEAEDECDRPPREDKLENTNNITLLFKSIGKLVDKEMCRNITAAAEQARLDGTSCYLCTDEEEGLRQDLAYNNPHVSKDQIDRIIKNRQEERDKELRKLAELYDSFENPEALLATLSDKITQNADGSFSMNVNSDICQSGPIQSVVGFVVKSQVAQIRSAFDSDINSWRDAMMTQVDVPVPVRTTSVQYDEDGKNPRKRLNQEVLGGTGLMESDLWGYDTDYDEYTYEVYSEKIDYEPTWWEDAFLAKTEITRDLRPGEDPSPAPPSEVTQEMMDAGKVAFKEYHMIKRPFRQAVPALRQGLLQLADGTAELKPDFDQTCGTKNYKLDLPRPSFSTAGQATTQVMQGMMEVINKLPYTRVSYVLPPTSEYILKSNVGVFPMLPDDQAGELLFLNEEEQELDNALKLYLESQNFTFSDDTRRQERTFNSILGRDYKLYDKVVKDLCSSITKRIAETSLLNTIEYELHGSTITKAVLSELDLELKKTPPHGEVGHVCGEDDHWLDLNVLPHKIVQSVVDNVASDSTKDITDATMDACTKGLIYATFRAYALDFLLRNIFIFTEFRVEDILTDGVLDWFAHKMERMMASIHLPTVKGETHHYHKCFIEAVKETGEYETDDDMECIRLNLRHHILDLAEKFYKNYNVKVKEQLLPSLLQTWINGENQYWSVEQEENSLTLCLGETVVVNDTPTRTIYWRHKVSIEGDELPVGNEERVYTPEERSQLREYLLICKLTSSMEFRAMFEYCLPVKKYLEVFTIYADQTATEANTYAADRIFADTRDKLAVSWEIAYHHDYENFDALDPFTAFIGGNEELRKLAENCSINSQLWQQCLGSDFCEMPGMGLGFIAKASWQTPLLIFKAFIELTDPNISIAIKIDKLLKMGGSCIPLILVSLGLLPINVFGIMPFGFGIGPPILPLGWLYHALFGNESADGGKMAESESGFDFGYSPSMDGLRLGWNSAAKYGDAACKLQEATSGSATYDSTIGDTGNTAAMDAYENYLKGKKN